MVYTTTLPFQTHPKNLVTAIFSKNGYIFMYLFNIPGTCTNQTLYFTMNYPKAGGNKIILKKTSIPEKKVLYILSL